MSTSEPDHTSSNIRVSTGGKNATYVYQKLHSGSTSTTTDQINQLEADLITESAREPVQSPVHYRKLRKPDVPVEEDEHSAHSVHRQQVSSMEAERAVDDGEDRAVDSQDGDEDQISQHSTTHGAPTRRPAHEEDQDERDAVSNSDSDSDDSDSSCESDKADRAHRLALQERRRAAAQKANEIRGRRVEHSFFTGEVVLVPDAFPEINDKDDSLCLDCRVKLPSDGQYKTVQVMLFKATAKRALNELNRDGPEGTKMIRCERAFKQSDSLYRVTRVSKVYINDVLVTPISKKQEVVAQAPSVPATTTSRSTPPSVTSGKGAKHIVNGRPPLEDHTYQHEERSAHMQRTTAKPVARQSVGSRTIPSKGANGTERVAGTAKGTKRKYSEVSVPDVDLLDDYPTAPPTAKYPRTEPPRHPTATSRYPATSDKKPRSFTGGPIRTVNNSHHNHHHHHANNTNIVPRLTCLLCRMPTTQFVVPRGTNACEHVSCCISCHESLREPIELDPHSPQIEMITCPVCHIKYVQASTLMTVDLHMPIQY